MFELNERLSKDSIKIGDLPLSELRLINDSQYIWLILVPRRDNITEIYQLSAIDQITLIEESSTLSRVLVRLFKCDKLNVAAIGNKVPQLHLHHVVRSSSDVSWPEPVWGRMPSVPYNEGELANILQLIQEELAEDLIEL